MPRATRRLTSPTQEGFLPATRGFTPARGLSFHIPLLSALISLLTCARHTFPPLGKGDQGGLPAMRFLRATAVRHQFPPLKKGCQG